MLSESSPRIEILQIPEQIEQINLTVGAFLKQYGSSATAAAIAPGRVNLIGEHIDYNGGCVLPAAIERWIVVAAAPSNNGRVALHDARTGECASFEVSDLSRTPQRSWTNYVRGVLAGFSRLGLTVSGLNLTLHSSIPLGGGLSSSAALEAVIGKVLCEVFGWTITGFDLAKLCQTAEHEYAGVPCGLMDQAAVILCRDNHLLLLNCASEEVVHVPYAMAEWQLMIINSGVAHELADGEYAKRRAVCQAAAQVLGVSNLCQLTTLDLRSSGERLSEEMMRCARHVLSENARTHEAVEALNQGDYNRVGRLLNASHASLRDDYRVSCAELDFIAATAQGLEGVAGCRMTGGGFGGSAIAVVHCAVVESVETAIERAFVRRFGRSLQVFVTRPVAGARAWSLIREAS